MTLRLGPSGASLRASGPESDKALPPERVPQSYKRLVWNQFKKKKINFAGLAVIAGLFFIALFASFLASDKPIFASFKGETYILPNLFEPVALRFYDNTSMREAMGDQDWAVFPPIPFGPLQNDLGARLKPPTGDHWLGTDSTGRDVAARLIHGTRISLSVGIVAVGIYVLIGIVLGALAGFYGGWVDALISRVTEVVLVFPIFFLILTIMGMVDVKTIFPVMAVIGFTSWTNVCRLIRGEILRIRELDYIQASRALGGGDGRIIGRHIIPNAISPVLVAATFGVAGAILIESSLAFLGFGTPPPAPSWGELLKQAYDYTVSPGAWWLTIFPGAAIFLTVTAYNLVGEGLRDAMDPRLKK